MTTGGGAWDNAKKYIETDTLEGRIPSLIRRRLPETRSAIRIRTSAGPAINPMIKILNIVAILIIGMLV